MSFLDHAKNHVALRESGRHMVGPCPKCGGSPDTTRFVVNTVKDFGQCYSCGWNADTIRFLREVEGLSCPEAHRTAGIPCDRPECPAWDKCSLGRGKRAPRPDDKDTPRVKEQKRREWVPSPAMSPAEVWQHHAMELVEESHRRLVSCPEQLAYLAGRGLPLQAVQRYRLGWIPKLEFRARKAWGLEDKWHEGEKRPITALPLYQGILIPWILDGRVHRLRIRKSVITGPKDPRYIWVDGSGTDIICLNHEARAHCPVESDLDGLLVDWFAGDLVGAVPLGSCSTHPKETVMALLKDSLRILVALDFDGELRGDKVHAPGGIASRWWFEHFPVTARRWPVPQGKDPGEAYAQGVDLRAWIIAGLPPVLRHAALLKREQKEPVPVETKGESNVANRPFDIDRAERLLRDSSSRIAAAYNAAAWDWLETHRPDAVEFIRGQQKCVEACLDQKDEERLVKSLDTLEKAYLRAWALYEGREPVIEREAPEQPALFDGPETCNAYQPE